MYTVYKERGTVHSKMNPRMMHAPWVLLACLPHLFQANGARCHGQHGVRLGNFLQRLIRAEGFVVTDSILFVCGISSNVFFVTRGSIVKCNIVFDWGLSSKVFFFLSHMMHGFLSPSSAVSDQCHTYQQLDSICCSSPSRPVHLQLTTIMVLQIKFIESHNMAGKVPALFVFEWLPLMASLVFVSLLAQVYLWFWCLGAVVGTENAFQTYFRCACGIR